MKKRGGLTIIIKGGKEKEIKEKRTDTKQQQPSKIKNKIWTRYRGTLKERKKLRTD